MAEKYPTVLISFPPGQQPKWEFTCPEQLAAGKFARELERGLLYLHKEQVSFRNQTKQAERQAQLDKAVKEEAEQKAADAEKAKQKQQKVDEVTAKANANMV